MKNLALFFASFLGVGFFPVAPGSAATAAGIVLVFLLQFSMTVYGAVTLLFLLTAIPVCTFLERELHQKDPGVLVIDEVVGIMIAFIGLPLNWSVVIIGFFLFRALDMFKIYPINRLEALPGGFGIMMDDVMAGLYTNIILHLAVRYAV